MGEMGGDKQNKRKEWKKEEKKKGCGEMEIGCGSVSCRARL